MPSPALGAVRVHQQEKAAAVTDSVRRFFALGVAVHSIGLLGNVFWHSPPLMHYELWTMLPVVQPVVQKRIDSSGFCWTTTEIKNPLSQWLSGFFGLLRTSLDCQLVPGTGIEPVRLAPRDFKSSRRVFCANKPTVLLRL